MIKEWWDFWIWLLSWFTAESNSEKIIISKRFGEVTDKTMMSCSFTRMQCVAYSRVAVFFYRAMLCIRGTSHARYTLTVCVRLSLSVSVTSRCSTKTAKHRITQTTPHDTPGTLVFWCQRSPRNSTGVIPLRERRMQVGWSKSATFDK